MTAAAGEGDGLESYTGRRAGAFQEIQVAFPAPAHGEVGTHAQTAGLELIQDNTGEELVGAHPGQGRIEMQGPHKIDAERLDKLFLLLGHGFQTIRSLTGEKE